jgi:hypothetical protein
MSQTKVVDPTECHIDPSTEPPLPILPLAQEQVLLPKPSPPIPPALPQSVAARGIGSVFDLDPRIAALAIGTDVILFTGDIFTVGGFFPMAALFAIGLGVITYKAQIAWHNDDRNSAMIKAMIVAFLTALPGPITPLFALPGGIVGLVKAIRRR